jgi:O-antigen biosynthesis protein
MVEPRFSIITPVHNPPEFALRAMLASVAQQSFADWQHCIVDDGSTASHVRPMLEAAARDPRVQVAFRPASGGIVAASSDGLLAAQGEFVVLLDHDDELASGALAIVDAALAAVPDTDYLYTDEDKIDEDNNHFDLFLKPDWSPERLHSQMYTCHLSVLRRSIVDAVGGFREGFDGSQDWDLVLRVTENARRVTHVREVLYHWRALAASAAADVDAKPYAVDAAARAVNEHFERMQLPCRISSPSIGGVFRVEPALSTRPLVSIVIPTAGGSNVLRGVPTTLVTNAVRSVFERSTYDNFEVVVVADASVTESTRDELHAVGGSRLQIVDYHSPFNFSEKVNMGTVRSNGEYVLLLNDDIEVLPDDWRTGWPTMKGTSGWIESMLMYAQQDGVGAVGAKLYFNDLRLQHVGVVLHGGLPSHPYRGFPSQYPGYFSNANAVCNYVAVTAACIMVPRSVYTRVGGFSLTLPVNYNDVDFCLKLHAAGLRCVYNPAAELLHYESATREAHVAPHEIARIQALWKSLLDDDPYYHPKFFQRNPDFHPAVMLRDGTLIHS